MIIRRRTIYGWLAAAADLCLPLVALLTQRVLSSKVVHTDDTSVKLIDPDLRGTRTARFWAYAGDAANPYTIYEFTETRQRHGPQEFLRAITLRRRPRRLPARPLAGPSSPAPLAVRQRHVASVITFGSPLP